MKHKKQLRRRDVTSGKSPFSLNLTYSYVIISDCETLFNIEFAFVSNSSRAEPVDFSRNDISKPSGNNNDSDRAFSLYSSIDGKSANAQSSVSMLRSVSSDDLMLKSSDDGSEDESDVDIVGDTKGYLS